MNVQWFMFFVEGYVLVKCYNGTMVSPSTGMYTSMPGMMWICGVSFAVLELQLVATVLRRTTHGNGGFAPAKNKRLFPIDSPTREVDLPVGTSKKNNEKPNKLYRPNQLLIVILFRETSDYLPHMVGDSH